MTEGVPPIPTATTSQPSRSVIDADAPESFWDRIPVIWKVIAAICAIAAGGFGVGVAWQSKAAGFATKVELAEHVKSDQPLRDLVRQLKETDVQRAEAISAIKADTTETKQDVRTLLKHMLDNPSPRRGKP